MEQQSPFDLKNKICGLDDTDALEIKSWFEMEACFRTLA